MEIDDVYWDRSLLMAFPRSIQKQYLNRQGCRLIRQAPPQHRGLLFDIESMEFHSTDIRIDVLYGIVVDRIAGRSTQKSWAYVIPSCTLTISVLDYPAYPFAKNATFVRSRGRDFGDRAGQFLHQYLGNDVVEFTGAQHGTLAATMNQWDWVRPTHTDRVLMLNAQRGHLYEVTEYYPTPTGGTVGIEWCVDVRSLS